MNIRARLTNQFIALVTAILLVFSVGVYFFSKLYLEKRFYKRLQDNAITTATLLFEVQAADTTVLKLVTVSDKELLHDESISVYSEKFRQFIFSTNQNNIISHEQVLTQIKAGMGSVFLDVGDYQVFGMKMTYAGTDNWVIVSAVDVMGKEALQDLRKILLVMVLVGVLLVGLSGWFFADKALAPMSGIIRQVNQIFPDNVDKRVQHPNRSDEIGKLVDTFNQLLNRIENALVMQKMFIANVSHELKNPLTKIYSQVEVTLMQLRSPEGYQLTLLSLQEDTRTLIQLTNALLSLANTVVSPGTMTKTSVRMDELLWEAKSQLLKWHENYQVHVNFKDFPDDENALVINGNEASLKVVLMNLMDNACKFSQSHEAIVNFFTRKGLIMIEVFNEGPAIPAEDLPYIFNAFYRSNSTANATKGHGVGLAIVAEITKIHDGEIKVESNSTGTTFKLIFKTA